MLIYFLHRMRSKYVHAQTIEIWIFFLLFYWTLLWQRCRQRNFNINIMTVIIYNSCSHVGLLVGLLEVISKLNCPVKFPKHNRKFQVTGSQVTTNCFIIIQPASISWPEISQNFAGFYSDLWRSLCNVLRPIILGNIRKPPNNW